MVLLIRLHATRLEPYTHGNCTYVENQSPTFDQKSISKPGRNPGRRTTGLCSHCCAIFYSTTSGDTAKDDTIQEGVATKTIGAMDTAHSFPCDKQTRNDLVVLIYALCGIVHLDATHAIMDDRCDNCNMVLIIDIHGKIVVEFLAPFVPCLATAISLIWSTIWILLLLLRILIVFFEGCFDILDIKFVFLGKFMKVVVELH